MKEKKGKGSSLGLVPRAFRAMHTVSICKLRFPVRRGYPSKLRNIKAELRSKLLTLKPS